MNGTIKIVENVSLKGYTTFKIGGEARFFVAVKTVEELQQALHYAEAQTLPVFILGGGSNILVSDEGFPGLVIKIEIGGIEMRDGDLGTEVVAGAGAVWDDLVAYAVAQGLYGIENLSLIPGTVGAAPVQNIGAYGAEIKDVISWVEVIDTTTKEIKIMTKAECAFGYRDSIFKKPEGKKYVITRVALVLKKNDEVHPEYKDIKEYCLKNNLDPHTLTLQAVRNIVIDIRTNKLPDLAVYGTAGSFFKNPIVEKQTYETLVQHYPGMPGFVVDDTHIKIPAAWILDNVCGFKGYRDGSVGVYKNQALVLVNFGEGTAQEIKKLSEKMINAVAEKTKIFLEREVQFV